tara:strand:+ start:275 stop:379 length:105 start_codon:yes stop_codon:yes gene_type:complete
VEKKKSEMTYEDFVKKKEKQELMEEKEKSEMGRR